MASKISVIIPVYNVEQYLEKCLDSILNQTYKNIEIILVNDGSIDKSGVICDEYSRKYNNIKVFHKENGGVSSARNLGIDNATGQYLAFVDPDDYIDPNMYEILVKKIVETNSDIAMCSFVYVKENENIVEDNSDETLVFDKEEVLRRYYTAIKPFNASFLCNKLFKKELFKEVRLDTELIIQEDTEVLIRIFNKIKLVVYVGIPLYSYLIRSGAATEGEISKGKVTTDISLLKIYEYTEKNFPRYKSIALNNYVICSFNIIIGIIKNYDDYGVYYKSVVDRLKKVYLLILLDRNIKLKYKLHSSLVLLSKNIYKIYIKKKLNQHIVKRSVYEKKNSYSNKKDDIRRN